jgi:hypothetical protein
MEFAMTTSDASLPATYSAVVTGLPDGTYRATVRAQAESGTVVSRTAATPFHAGALVVTKVVDAEEATLSPGTFRISRADVNPTELPALTFDVAFSDPGLAAIVEPTVASLTIPAGAASVDVSVTPIYTTDIDADVALTLSVSGASIGTPSSGSITIVNSPYDPSVRYVATTGSDENHGGTPELPKKTIGAAVESLAPIVQTLPCTVHVAPGRYPISTPISLTKAVKLVGDGDDPSYVVVSNTVSPNWNNKNFRCLFVNHESAWVSGLTFENGQQYFSGGNIMIDTNGGVISNCIIRAGMVRNNDAAGSNLAVNGPGLVTHCTIQGGYVGAESTGSGKISSVYLGHESARIENCLVDGFVVPSSNTKGGCGLRVEKGAAVNCTVVNTQYNVEDADKQAKLAGINVTGSGVATNCVSSLNADPSGILRSFLPGQSGSLLVSCAYDGIAGSLEPLSGMVTPVVGTASSFFKDYANGDYTPKTGGPLVGKGANYEGMASVDLAGRARLVGRKVDIGCYEAGSSAFVIRVR